MNTYKASRLHFLPMLSRYSRMSERVQHDEQCSSLHNRWCFRYDEQCSSLHAEGLRGSVSGNHHFLIACGTWMETTSHKKSTKHRDSVVKRQQLKFAQHGASQSGELPHGAVIPCNLGMLNIHHHKQSSHLTWHCRGLSQANLQRWTLQSKNFQ